MRGAAAPDGRSADSGAIFLQGGTLTMRNSSLTDNEASLSATMPSDVPGDVAAVAGAIHLAPNVSTATIDHSTIAGNSARMTNTLGDADRLLRGIHVDVGVTFALTNSVVSDNRVTAATLPGSSGSIEADSAAGELHGTISNTSFVGNTVSVRSAARRCERHRRGVDLLRLNLKQPGSRQPRAGVSPTWHSVRVRRRARGRRRRHDRASDDNQRQRSRSRRS